MAMLRVCGVQMAVGAAKKDNLPRILEHIKSYTGDFILFPEMALTGFNNQFSDARTEEAWRQIAAACRQSYVTAILGAGARVDGRAYIQTRVITDAGELLGVQDKLVPAQSEREWSRPGEELHTFAHKGVRFGCLCGNDLWVAPGFGPYPDPRLTMQLGQMGAQIIFHGASTGADPRYAAYYDSNLRLRAIESGCYIITANAAAGSGALSAPTGIVSPQGEWLVQCPREGEHRFCYDLEVEAE